jgi:hypothetical protein
VYLIPDEKPKLTKALEQTLQETVISDDQPGTILRDFAMFLDHLGDGMPLTPTQQIPLKTLSALNAKLTVPIKFDLKRAAQKSYPHLGALLLVVRASGLTYTDGTPEKPILRVDAEMCAAWDNLNATERYGTLLEAWLLRGRPDIIGEFRRPFESIPDNFYEVLYFFDKIPAEGIDATTKDAYLDELNYHPGLVNLAAMEMFGLIRIEHGAVRVGKGWQVERIHRTPLGDAMIAALYTRLFSNVINTFLVEDEGKMPYGILSPIMRQWWPAWKNDLPAPQSTFRAGVYTFKLVWDKAVWRKITLDATHTFDDFALIITKALNFYFDHLYEFIYPTRYGYESTISHPALEDPPFTSETRIGDVPFRVGQPLMFHFDFGDDWYFPLVLEQVEAGKSIKKPKVTEKQGKAPSQYGHGNGDGDEGDSDWDGSFYIIRPGGDKP